MLGDDFAWALTEVPLLDFDDDAENTTVALAYYFRWRSFRRHVRQRRDPSRADQRVQCCAGPHGCALVSSATGWCAGAVDERACHLSRTEGRPCVWASGRCTKGWPHGSEQLGPQCPAAARAATAGGGSHGWVVTEFEPEVPWAGVDNTIACSAGHHFLEGRWLRNSSYLDSYAHFWFGGGGEPRRYSFWAATAMHARYLVTGEAALLRSLYRALVANYDAWVGAHWSEPAGCFWQYADRDGQEHSIGGDGCRPLLNAMMVSEARTLASVAALVDDADGARRFAADQLRWQRALLSLWSEPLQFFVTRHVSRPDTVPKQQWSEAQVAAAQQATGGRCPPRWPEKALVSSRELQGLSSPWYFEALPSRERRYDAAWARLFSEEGLWGPWGPRTAERSDPCYRYSTEHECTWNGPSWPFETSKVIAAAMNALRAEEAASGSAGRGEGGGVSGGGGRRVGLRADEADGEMASHDPSTARVATAPRAAKLVRPVSEARLWMLVRQYARAHTHSFAINSSAWELPGTGRTWIGEALDPDTGAWLVRAALYAKGDRARNRGARYNHSTFCDLILQLLGLRPTADGKLVVRPLLPRRTAVRFFAIDGVRMHGRNLCIAYDRDGARYGLGAGLHVMIDGKVVASGQLGDRLEVDL